MSHFTVLVIGENPEKQLEPFDENLTMPRYVKATKSQLIEQARQKIKEYNDTVYKKYIEDPEKYALNVSNDGHLEYLKNEFPKKLSWSDEEIYQEAIKYEDDIGPEGEIYSTYNPNSKWDWYQLGGRWAGSIQVKEGVEFKKPEFSWGWDHKSQEEVLSSPRTDSAKVKDIANLSELRTFAVLKDGKWYERGEMGWWGIVSDEKESDQWEKEYQKLLEGLPEDTLLSVYDCHI